ncbi:hypothetical protein DVH05_000864 [Phytophthora capsici]|nr:hypothetical protein DVH05_000864 [Phytophthora capsici]
MSLGPAKTSAQSNVISEFASSKQQSSVMNATARILCPPNFQVMSADVIRSVTERAHPTHYREEDPVPYVPRYELPFPDQFPTERSRRSHEPPREASNTILTTEKKTKKFPSADNTESEFQTQLSIYQAKTKNKNQARQRIYQRRYRAKREAYRITLENETQQLQNEIQQLKVQRTNDTLWAMVAEYFSLLQQSITSRSPLNSLNAVHNAERLVMKRTLHHNNMMMCWCLPQYFDHVDVELQQLKRSTRNSLVATTVTSFIITSRTLAKVFPHLCSRDGRRGGAIATKLLDKRIVTRGWMRFERDDTDSRVLRITSQSDLLTPVLDVLRSLEKVAIVFEEALVTPDFQWRST